MGHHLAHQGDAIFATLFTYGLEGRDLWLVMAAGLRQPDGSYVGDLYRTTGPAFNAQPFTPLGASDVVKVGSMRLRFTSGEAATLDYSVDGVSVSKAIVREVFASPLPRCDG